jgi:DNA ligase-associated metallophosphoesterase
VQRKRFRALAVQGVDCAVHTRHSGGMVPFSFAGHDLCALRQNAVFWPARAALLVADLHFEKASWFARSGQMLPPYDSIATLTDLTALADETGAREIWCLGDSFHDTAGCDRLPDAAQVLLRALTTTRRWVWITGNHDPYIARPHNEGPHNERSDIGRGVDRCGGEVMNEALVDGLVLRHEADPAETRPELSGHFHPKLRLRVRGKLVSRQCFIATSTKIILPAFGSLTGGLDATHPEIVRATGGSAHALIAVEDRLLRFPLAA